MIDRAHHLPLNRQAKALGISRGSVYYLPRAVPAADMARGFVYLAAVVDWFSRKVWA